MPSVSIIIPCFNEQNTIRKLLEAIYAQTFPRANLEVVIADGMSTDGTRAQIASFADSHPDLRIAVVDNQKRDIPAGLNSALKVAQGEIIVRLDAHSMPYPNYIELCVADLEAGLGENVGGVWEIRPSSEAWVAQSIAVAAAHPLGVGDALYRHAGKSAPVDTVPFGAFKRELLALVGFFDETLLTNEDYEFNARIRKSGGIVWLDPSIRSVYFARATFSGLAKQYFRYGFWKWRMLRRYPNTLRWRQGLPPLFVVSLIGLGILGIFLPLFRVLLAAEIILYTFALTAAGVQAVFKQKKFSLFFGLPLAISCMHISWGMGFLWSMIRGVFTNHVPEKK
ncbi:MAG: glycosyltransferase family 2 protein [Chloroflexi bacterium]|nr:glycosyltransferase family 2 protein [Chloroflexota bacterium]